MTGFCEADDVRTALQKTSAKWDKGPLTQTIIDDAIRDVSDWFARASGGHWYDGGSTIGSPVGSSVKSALGVWRDVPSSPHRQDRQLFHDEHGVRYPNTNVGPYAKVPLPHRHVSSITTLDVRDRGGDVTDWVADGDIKEGRGEDYYVDTAGANAYGHSYLFIRGSSIGPRINFDNLLTIDYDYGLDWASEEWWDVRRGVANLAGAQAIDEDNVLNQVPENASLAGVETQHSNLVSQASRNLDKYLVGSTDGNGNA